jgi:hypothetical protein
LNKAQEKKHMQEQQITSLRESWDFVYETSQVLAAAQQRVAHHQGRMDWWSAELQTAETKLKEKGFEYREEHRSIGPGVVIVGDPQLASRVTECRRKMEEHSEKLRAYESWVRALSGKEKREHGGTLVLKIQDVEFFRL